MEAVELVWWHWVVLAGVLLALEMFGAGGFLLGFVVSGLITALLEATVGLSWEWQLLCFSSIGLILSYLYVKKFKKFNNETDQPELNNRLVAQIGRQGEVVQVLGGAEYKIKIGDTLWRVNADVSLEVGDAVAVKSAEGDHLSVDRV